MLLSRWTDGWRKRAAGYARLILRPPPCPRPLRRASCLALVSKSCCDVWPGCAVCTQRNVMTEGLPSCKVRKSDTFMERPCARRSAKLVLRVRVLKPGAYQWIVSKDLAPEMSGVRRTRWQQGRSARHASGGPGYSTRGTAPVRASEWVLWRPAWTTNGSEGLPSFELPLALDLAVARPSDHRH